MACSGFRLSTVYGAKGVRRRQIIHKELPTSSSGPARQSGHLQLTIGCVVNPFGIDLCHLFLHSTCAARTVAIAAAHTYLDASSMYMHRIHKPA